MEKNVSACMVIIVLLGCLSVWQYYWHTTEITSLDSQITNLVREMLNLIASSLEAVEYLKAYLELRRKGLGRLTPEKITEQIISDALYTMGMPDPDLLIRTSAEYRLSNFLLWQMAYTEFYFTPTLWPEFRKEEYLEAIEEYQKRERRFGATGEK